MSESAEEGLRAAVVRMLEDNDIAQGVITEIAVVTAQQYYDDEGLPHTMVASLWPDTPPHYRRLGLLEYEVARLKGLIECVTDVTDDDD